MRKQKAIGLVENLKSKSSSLFYSRVTWKALQDMTTITTGRGKSLQDISVMMNSTVKQ